MGYLPLYVILQGSGIGGSAKPSLTVTPAAVTYGTLNGGTSATQAIVVENFGNQTVKLGKATIVGPQAANFSVAANSCGSAPIGLPPGSSCTFNVKFSPAGAVISTAMLQIASSTGVLLASTTLEGTTNYNTSPILSLSSNALTFMERLKVQISTRVPRHCCLVLFRLRERTHLSSKLIRGARCLEADWRLLGRRVT